jgi:hypothetical protein
LPEAVATAAHAAAEIGWGRVLSAIDAARDGAHACIVCARDRLGSAPAGTRSREGAPTECDHDGEQTTSKNDDKLHLCAPLFYVFSTREGSR